MKLINNSSVFISVNDVLIKKELIQLIKIGKDPESIGGEKHLYVSTGLVSIKIYGREKIKSFLSENYPKKTINEILLK